MPAVPVSVVIICKNAAATIGQTAAAALKLSDDVVVLDSGSTDATIKLVNASGARLVQQEWLGYGATKNQGNSKAKYDWILSLDADEIASDELIASIKQLELTDALTVYKIKRLNYIKDQPIHHGEWGKDWTVRLFNRTVVQWNDAPVHESLLLPPAVTVVKLAGLLHHFTTPDIATYQKKLEKYADLMAAKYFAGGKRGSALKPYASSFFSFLKYYLFHAGWLDKAAGWQLALAHARYTFQKYKKLQALHQAKRAVET
ncbi:MAG: glycosyltransferase family 2 protein [Flaviaesturariibacter sp.]|nr:glycosyltransferase family 2 protein [Flaviaesturariibacter sp.]